MSALTIALNAILGEFVRRQAPSKPATFEIIAVNCWALSIACDITSFPGLCIRSLKDGDEPLLQIFGTQLGPVSKDLFSPYPWHDPSALSGAFQKAVQNAKDHVDAAYLIESARHGVIGHFFLWKAGGNPHSHPFQIEVPELGVAIADRFQGKGLGRLSVRILQAVARELGLDAIELTTAFDNEAGWKAYRGCGFEYTGNINTPLGVDVTAALAGEVRASAYRSERQMVYVINEEKRDRVLNYLAEKRRHAPG